MVGIRPLAERNLFFLRSNGFQSYSARDFVWGVAGLALFLFKMRLRLLASQALCLFQHWCASFHLTKPVPQPIPDTWRKSVHYILSETNTFHVGEVCVVSRSNGSKTFGLVEKVHINNTMDVKVGEQQEGSSGAAYHRTVDLKEFGKIVDNVFEVVMLRDIGGVQFTEAAAEIVNTAMQVSATRGQSECGVVHVAAAALSDKKGK